MTLLLGVPHRGRSSGYMEKNAPPGANRITTSSGTLYNDPDICRLHNTPGIPQELRACIASIIAPAVPDARKTVLIVHAWYWLLIRAKGVAVRLRTMIMLVERLLRGVSGTSSPAAVEIAE